MSRKQQRYFSGMPDPDPNKPLPGEISAQAKRRFFLFVAVVVIFASGTLFGFALSPETPDAVKREVAGLERELKEARREIEELSRTLSYKDKDAETQGQGLAERIAERHRLEGGRISRALRAQKAQGASQLTDWFVDRWNRLLESSEDDDRVTRRAATLSLLVGGMGENLHPADYVPWQAEFLSGAWLAELHYDLDGDGLPGPRSGKNRNDGFTDVSICHIAMALNQAVTDAQILVMPELRCHEASSRMSVFLQGETYDDALDAFVAAAKREGFLVVEKSQRKTRLILIGAQQKRRKRR